MQMKHPRSMGLVALVAGVTAVSGIPAYAAEMPSANRYAMYVAAAGESHSHGTQGYLGIEMRDVSEDQIGVLRLKEARGAEITTIDHDGPACKAGMRMHDVILQLNGQVIEGEEQLRRMLHELPVGRSVSFVISRDGQTQTMTMTTADRKSLGAKAWGEHYSVPAPAYGVRGNSFLNSGSAPSTNVTTPKGHKDLLGTPTVILSSSFTGAKLEVMGQQLAEFFGAPNGAGLLVRSVDENSPAEDAGFKAGDVVVRVNSIAVSNGDDWTKTVHDNKGKPVPVVVLRDKKEQTLTLTPDGKKRSSLWGGFGLEDFFEQTSQQTRQLLAKL